MNLRKIRSKCMVKGCRHGGIKFDCYNVSLSAEYGGSVCMCAECIKTAAAELKALEKRAKEAEKQEQKAGKPEQPDGGDEGADENK